MVDNAARLSLKDFVDKFWPLPPGTDSAPVPSENPFTPVTTCVADRGLEKDVAAAFIQAVNACTLTPGMSLVGCPDRSDEGTSKLRADGAFYRTGNPNAPVPDDGKPHFEDQIVVVAFKRGDTSVDAFSDDCEPCPVANDRTEAREQITSFAEKAFTYQHRVALYLLLVNGTECRLTRWDRSGVIFTVALDYCKQWKVFCKILWRMSQCTDEQLGLDPTAHRIYRPDPLYKIMDDEAQHHASDINLDDPSDLDGIATDRPIVYTYIRELFKRSLLHDAPRYLLDVPYGNETRQYLVGRPTVTSKGAIGRGTLGFAALDRETREFAWLKDCWRADYPGVESEGQILRELNEAGVPYIPTMVCYGDLPGQKTIGTEMWEWACARLQKNKEIALANRTSGPRQDGGPRPKARRKQKLKPKLPSLQGLDGTTVCPMRVHQHARLVVKEIALPLRDFQSGNELLSIIRDCLQAHYSAMDGPAPRLHRDISDSNIMIMPRMVQKHGTRKIVVTGLLCDWEMSKRIDAEAGVRAPRQPVRSGTWQFKSVMLLNKHDKAVEVCDELESFFYVIVYYSVRYLKSNLSETQVADFIDQYFNTFMYNGGKWHCGHHRELVLAQGALETANELQLQFGEPMDSVLGELLLWFHSYYVIQKYKASVAQRATPTSPTPTSSAPSAPLRLDNQPGRGQANRWIRRRNIKGLDQNRERPRTDPAGSTDPIGSSNPSSSVNRHFRRSQVIMPTAEEYALAEKVKTHDGFMQLLYFTLKDVMLGDNQPDNARDPSGDRYVKGKGRHYGNDTDEDDEDEDDEDEDDDDWVYENRDVDVA